MATQPEHDPIDEEVALILRDPKVRQRLEDFEARLARGEVERVPHAEVRRRLGLDQAPDRPPSE